MRDAETSVWSAEEIEAYRQAMMKYDKDFFLVSQQVNYCGCSCAVACHLPLVLVKVSSNQSTTSKQ